MAVPKSIIIISIVVALILAIGLAVGIFVSAAPPVKLGLVAGLSGRVADLGIGGRNGAMFAVEQWNRNGGVNGRHVELLTRDDKQNEATARKGVQELIAARVDAIIGPFTSSMSVATIALVNEAEVVMMSPTTTADQLQEIDDYFLRVISTTRGYAGQIAGHLHDRLGLKRVAVIYDLQNASYSEAYHQNFRRAFESLGGEISVILPFRSGEERSFLELARKVVTPETEGVFIIANSMDAANFCQQIRKLDPHLPLATSEWAATAKIIELGGRATEGLFFGQFFDRESTYPRYLDFFDDYLCRFSEEPGFAAVASYDAVNVVLQGIQKMQNGQSLKEAILSQSAFHGVQGPLQLDPYGDARRESYIYTIRDGRFVGVK